MLGGVGGYGECFGGSLAGFKEGGGLAGLEGWGTGWLKGGGRAGGCAAEQRGGGGERGRGRRAGGGGGGFDNEKGRGVPGGGGDGPSSPLQQGERVDACFV